MKTKVDLLLINGTFTPVEAKEILMNIFASKIQFHELKNLRVLLTTNAEDKTSTLRVQELKKTIEELNLVTQEANENGLELSIKSQIEITFLKSKTAKPIEANHPNFK
jgi:hypothetical protein